MRIFFVSAELAPFAQAGGLGDAVAGLARALGERGHDVTCMIPAWPGVRARAEEATLRPAGPVQLDTPEGRLEGRWWEGRAPGEPALRLLEMGGLFEETGLYAGEGEAEARRMIALSRAAAARCDAERPDVVVAHDWPAALTLACLRTLYDTGATRGVAAVQAVHNNAYQGRASAELHRWTGLPGELFRPEGLEFYGDLSLLKGGLVFADRIVTVSPTYARDLQTVAFGGGLEGLYRARADRLEGVVNGLDVGRFDPARDAAIEAGFDARHPEGKARCRSALCAELGLAPPRAGRLAAAVGRLSAQKGWDVLAAAMDALVARGFGLALLGSGEPALAARLRTAAERQPEAIHLREGWHEAHARRLYAGADLVLVPSRFEPCGLVQLLAQRYGAIPVAHRVNGLVDTVADGRSGILFEPLDVPQLVAAAERAASWLGASGPRRVRHALMELDLSWRRPAERWEALLGEAAREGRRRL